MPTTHAMQLQLYPLLEAKIALDRMTSPTSAHFHPAAADNDMDFNQLDLSEGATALNRRRFKVKISPSGKLLKVSPICGYPTNQRQEGEARSN